MKNFKNYFLSVLLGAVVLVGCKRDDDPTPPTCDDPGNPECPNYDPCLGSTEVTADFKIFDDIHSAGPNVGTYYQDSVLYAGNVKFEAIEKDAYYKWYLGQEVIEGFGDSIVIKGINNLDPGTYTAALVVEKAPDTLCFPMDTGRDSTFRTFTVVDKCDLMVINKFKGVFDFAPEDSTIIELYWMDPQTREPDCESFIMGTINFEGMGDTTLVTGSGVCNRYIHFDNNEFTYPVGDFEVFPDNTLRAAYLKRGQNYVFNGKLLPE